MRISVSYIYVLALLVAALAATLGGIFLSTTFSSLQAASELAQRNLGEGQVRAFTNIVAYQMERIRSESEATSRQLAMWAERLPASAFAAPTVLASLNQSIYDSWVPTNRANNSINGRGLTLMYPANTTNVTFAKAFGVWKDITRNGQYTYVYAVPSATSNFVDVYENVWTGFATPTLTKILYSYDPFNLDLNSYMRDDYFTKAVPWSAADGNSYWTFPHQRHVVLHGVSATVQAWDIGLDWRDRMDAICTNGSEMLVIDNYDMVMAATSDEEAQRLAECQSNYTIGPVQAPCLRIPAAQYPVADIRNLRNALFNSQWADLSTPTIPISHVRLQLHGQSYMVVVATLFSSGDFRTTVLWYQPWTELSTDVPFLVAVICLLIVLSTMVLTLLGIFGILRPLIHLGRSMRTVAHQLKYGDGGGGDKALVQRSSFFQEVYNIQMDFETIVMDFLGFSSTRKASEQADTVLNHILKNTMADAAACIQLYAEDKVAQVPPDLAQAVTCLARGMQWCRKRHVLLRMSEGDYLPALHPVSLREFGEQLVRGRDVLSSFPNEVVLLDEVLCDILLDNALNNAFRHGNPPDPDVQFFVDLAPLEEPGSTPSGRRSAGSGGLSRASSHRQHRLLTFCIRNRADPNKPPVTPDLINTVLMGHRVSEEFVYSSALSEHLGLRHMFKVAETHQMDMSLKQEGDTVVLRALLKVQLAKERSVLVQPDIVPELEDIPLPTGLNIWALDDSPIARRLMEYSLPKYFPGSTVSVLGDTPADIQLFIAGASAHADIIILDQHLDYSTESFLGTAVLADLLQQGCRAFVCFRSACVVLGSDVAFRAAGAHCVLGKDLRPDDFFKALMRLYRAFLTYSRNPSLISVPAGSP
eukprot:EG_transcript_1149